MLYCKECFLMVSLGNRYVGIHSLMLHKCQKFIIGLRRFEGLYLDECYHIYIYTYIYIHIHACVCMYTRTLYRVSVAILALVGSALWLFDYIQYLDPKSR